MNIREVRPVGSRGKLITFEDHISVYLIQTEREWFLCDTHLGPLSMEAVKAYMSQHSTTQQPMILFNSHSDWDHIWGNCAFENAWIIGHELCRKRMQQIGAFELAKLTEYHQGTIDLVLPNLTFSERLSFEEAELEFIYTPGHTVDSAVCFDKKDQVLFVGDLVEEPIPYLDFSDLEMYIKTLEFIKSFPAKVKISAHSGIVDHALIQRNIDYIKAILQGSPVAPSSYQATPEVHRFNVNNRLFLKYEHWFRQSLTIISTMPY
ncbi:MBL fold metallo-hydrolase [Sporomusaceae bacterium FL31]|nr:MBL fold metallo-hydrolase [Sporomusaceae bacterium FL31]GCE34385.1 MBL fold metallo-hydrolase [Sporomusaceae bacterium]